VIVTADLASPSARTVLTGCLLAALSGLAIAIGPNLARIAYADGADVLSVMILRGLAMALICIVILRVRGMPLLPERSVAILCVLSGIAFAAMSYGYFSAVQFIPVGLAVVLYFVHPMIVSIFAHLRGLTVMSLRHLLCGVTVLGGLAICVGADPVALATRDGITGLALAMVAAIAVSAMILINAQAIPKSDPVTVNSLMVAVTTLIFVSVAVLPGSGFSLPAGPEGWSASAGVGITFTIGLLSFFYAVKMIGAVRATMITSLQPVFATLFASMMLDEFLTTWQWLGIIVVVSALVMRDLDKAG
jgi:drug/metabolite transporter (DMT)-like permease